MLGGNLSPDFSAILKLAGVEGGLENNLFRGNARVFEGEQALLAALDQSPETFQNHDMVIVRYEGPAVRRECQKCWTQRPVLRRCAESGASSSR